MNDCCFIYLHVFVVEYPLKWCTYSAVLVVTRLVTCETAAVSACFVYTIQPMNHAPVYSITVHTMLFWLLRGWWTGMWNCYHLCTFCVHHTTVHQFTVSLYLKPDSRFKIIISFKKLKRSSHTHTHTHMHVHTHCSDVWTNLSIQKWYWVQAALDFGTQIVYQMEESCNIKQGHCCYLGWHLLWSKSHTKIYKNLFILVDSFKLWFNLL